MKASDYRAYREEQAIYKEINKPNISKGNISKDLPYTGTRPIKKATQTPNKPINTKESYIKDTLMSYKRLNNKYLELNEMIKHYTPTANISKYGDVSSHTNKKHDISDELVKRENIAIQLINTTMMRLHIKDCLFKTTALAHSDILYLIYAYVDETEKISYSKSKRIIKKIADYNIEIPTIKQVKNYLNEKYKDNP